MDDSIKTTSKKSYYFTMNEKNVFKEISTSDIEQHDTVFTSAGSRVPPESMHEALESCRILKPAALKVTPFRDIKLQDGDIVFAGQNCWIVMGGMMISGFHTVELFNNTVPDLIGSVQSIFRRSDNKIIFKEVESTITKTELLCNGYSPLYAFENFKHIFDFGEGKVVIHTYPSIDKIVMISDISLGMNHAVSALKYVYYDVKSSEGKLQKKIADSDVPVSLVFRKQWQKAVCSETKPDALQCNVKISSVKATIESYRAMNYGNITVTPIERLGRLIPNKLFIEQL